MMTFAWGWAWGESLKRRAGRDLRCLVGALLLTTAAGVGHAQDTSETSTVITRSTFTQHAWAQIRPNYAYLNGCVTGYRAFVFSDDGYFVFNRNIRGWWRITSQGNLILVNRGGQHVTLFYDKHVSLTPIVTNTGAAPGISAGTKAATTPPATAATATTSANPSNTRTAAAPTSAGSASPTGHIIVVPTGNGRTIIVPIPPPTAAAPNTAQPQATQSSTNATNPIYTVSASGRLQFRHGDRFTECLQ
jgi:hypothetical protein